MTEDPMFWIFVCNIDYDLSDMEEDQETVADTLEELPPFILFQVNQDQLLDYFADPDEWIAETITENTTFLINGAGPHRYVGEVDPTIDPDELLEQLVWECKMESEEGVLPDEGPYEPEPYEPDFG